MNDLGFGVRTTASVVEAWNRVRLSYEPKAAQQVYRTHLRDALLQLRPLADALLDAEYATPDSDFADLENVLLYNVGARFYMPLASNGIVCRRVPSPDELHRVRYSLSDSHRSEAFDGEAIARTSVLDPVREHGPAGWWAGFRPRLEVSERRDPSGEFTVSVEVGTRWQVRSAMASLKPMLDGLISALHVHNGSNRDHIVRALSHVGPPSKNWALLTDPRDAVLGERRLIRPHGAGIAWNPADERCSAFRVLPGHRDAALTITVAEHHGP